MPAKKRNKADLNCVICGEAMPDTSPLALMSHLLYYHPIEFFESSHGQNILRNVSQGLFNLGLKLAGGNRGQ